MTRGIFSYLPRFCSQSPNPKPHRLSAFEFGDVNALGGRAPEPGFAMALKMQMMQTQPWVRLHKMCTPLQEPALLQQLGHRRPCRRFSFHIRASSTSGPTSRNLPWLVVGLGNPGSKFQGTRHNVGFEMLDAIAQAEGISMQTIQHKALIGKGYIGATPVLLAKPQTYMNLSGESVGPIAAYYKIPVERVLAIYDDLDLEFAVMRMLPKGGHGGHNGMRSLIDHFKGNRDFPRLRFGIGRPVGTMDPKAYVLQKFSSTEREELNIAFQRGIEGVRLLTSEGLEKAVSTWNAYRKSKLDSLSS